jgi:hypothetical protein
MRRRARLLVAVAALGLGAPACRPKPAPALVVEIDARSPGRVVPEDFFGLSVEWDTLLGYLGDGAGKPRAPTVALLSAFAQEGHRPLIRIGGNSQDLAWWSPTGGPLPPGARIGVGPAHLATLARVQAALGNRLIIGLNLAVGDAENAAALVAAARRAIAADGIAAFELGNEPDSYVPAHRPAGYDFATYLSEARALRDGITARLRPATPLPFAWPALATGRWLPDLDAELAAGRGLGVIVSAHKYPYSVCDGLPAPRPSDLLADLTTTGLATSFAPHIAAARAAGVRFRMGEVNTVSCGGAPGVSDSFASALWGATFALQMAVAGADGVDFHGGALPGGPSHYAAFVYDAAGRPVVRPLYYGLRLASLATAARGRLLPVRVTGAALRAFATRGDDGAVRVLVTNPTATAWRAVKVEGPVTDGTPTLVRLRAPSLGATAGLTLGGATWDGSRDGTPSGLAATEALSREQKSWLTTLAPYEAVVVTFPAGTATTAAARPSAER